ncbi:tryptophan 2,3-dioxygenase family protein [Vulgatibacter incomptus]|uniref:Tryptophan 2,3-dioxygenase n=1 Tax=Vulgatibacter incomptus TaxID=1391653 RepID=A0A0K1PDK3_9BACT|nr:tryptophan 2,3-dioxygenase family protein [Vulgatibacter incomptus]AKU91623.1 Tryptophan 2,3-dioxygenase [Vulgatibacter incomptus]
MEHTPSRTAREDLRQQLEAPIYNSIIEKWVGKGELDYERYLRTPELLSLQTPTDERVVFDELLFQVIHQAQELWLKLAAHESIELVGDLDADRLWEGSARLERIARTLTCVRNELAILETLTPATYQVIRRTLGNGSGQESPGYNAMRIAGKGVEEALERLLARRGLRLEEVYSSGEHPDLERICEQLVDVDEAFQGWLYGHFQLVRRTIGVDRSVKALDGIPTQVLSARMSLPLFRALWDVKVALTASWKREDGPSRPLPEVGR